MSFIINLYWGPVQIDSKFPYAIMHAMDLCLEWEVNN